MSQTPNLQALGNPFVVWRKVARTVTGACVHVRGTSTAALVAIALGVVAAFGTPDAAAASAPSTNLPWVAAASAADIDAAFARARAENNKPVLLYWGATWCPPCNQLKATLFNRQEFATLSKHFVAVHVDGDRPGAQKLGERFKVSGYPSTVLFTAQGQEITRLPGGIDPPQAMALLQLGLAGGRPAKAVLGDALAGKPLGANEWRALAYYAWELDEQQLVPKNELPSTLASLALASTKATGNDSEAATRLWLKAMAASDDGKGLKADDGMRQRVDRVLADPAASRLHMDVLVQGATDIVQLLEDELSPRRAALVGAFDRALARLQADTTLSRSDRLDALTMRVDLARLGQPRDTKEPKVGAELVAAVREFSARADREITDGYERQAVITSAAYALAHAGLWADSDALLKSNLAKSHSPYYLMSQLGSNAKKLGKRDEALRWYGEAYDKSEGPATRTQWGVGYLSALIELAPQDAARIEKVAAQVLREAATDSAAFEGRSGRQLQRVGNKLAGWGEPKQAAVLKRLRAQLGGVCARVESAQRPACEKVLKGASLAEGA